MKIKIHWIYVSIVFLLCACQTYSDADKQEFDKKIQAYLTKKKLKCQRSDSGLYVRILESGKGNYLKFQDEVSFTYQGSLIDGTVFDDQKKPVKFKVRELIAAWKELMIQLKPGAKAFLVAPPQLAYGDYKLKDIPQHSILIYTIKIIDVN